MMKMLSVWQVMVVLLAVDSQTLALNPLGLLRSHIGSLYEMRDQLSSRPSGRKVGDGASRPAEIFHDTNHSSLNTQLPHSTTSATVVHYSRANTENSVIGSLFELGQSDIEGQADSFAKKKGPMRIDQKHVAPLNEILKEISNMTFLPLVPMNGSPPAADGNVSAKSPILRYLDGIRGNAWGQFKSMALSYTNWLDHEYQVQDITEKLPLDLIKKILDLGDRVNFLHAVGKRVDPGLAEYLADQMQPIFDHFESLTAGRMLGGSLASTLGGIVRDSAWKAMRQFVGHVLKVAGNFVTKDELEKFKLMLAKTSPMAAKGLDFVLNGFPGRSSAAEGRSFMGRNGYNDHDDGYGHSGYNVGGGGYGGYGAYDDYSSYGMQGYSSGGYAAGVYLDPYLILGGLGAAVLLAFLAYRVIVTTEAAKRALNDLTFMDLSDVPGIVHSIYSMLGDADDKYKSKRSLSAHMDDSDDLAQGLNSLWREHNRDFGCVRCSFFDYAVAHTHSDHDLIQGMAVAGLATLLGAERSGQLMDEVTSLRLEGRPISCVREANTCTVK
ncbi:LOW QUALITY PROTEIN: uncharacterized protein [Panulirus ornatus]|uniref:LOW QUALITY PROTEIN: uncharacterized protein n=1 Tax=Panulirus ornatus TaxID=150431 RepID=UPI003A86B1A7